MAQPQFVDKAQLFAQLTDIVENQETGFLTILTDTNRSVLLRFSRGKLTRLHSRSKEAGDAIQVLAESTMVKYTYVDAPEDDEPELMPATSFLQLIDPGNASAAPSARLVHVSGGKLADEDPVKEQMIEIATEYVGVVAEMIVDEAFAENPEIGQVIKYVCDAIPDEKQANAFREDALAHFTSIDI